MAPETIKQVEVYHNSSIWQSISGTWTWTEYGNSWTASEPLTLPVRQGDLLRFVSQNAADQNVWFTVWYQFTPQIIPTSSQKQVLVRSIFENQSYQVFQIQD